MLLNDIATQVIYANSHNALQEKMWTDVAK